MSYDIIALMLLWLGIIIVVGMLWRGVKIMFDIKKSKTNQRGKLYVE